MPRRTRPRRAERDRLAGAHGWADRELDRLLHEHEVEARRVEAEAEQRRVEVERLRGRAHDTRRIR